MELQTKAKKWGSSIGVIIPKDIIEKERISEGQEIRINILSKKKTTGADIFGKLKFSKPVEALLDETDELFELDE